MRLGRLLRLLLTNLMDRGITVFVQLVVPPFFLRTYANGVEAYGEWLALSASINYLQTLNYGVQTYANNQVTILYSGGDLQQAKAVQSSALRLLLLLALLLMLLGTVVFLVPVTGLLKLRYVAPRAAELTVYLLIMQMAVAMIFDFLTNSFMAVGLLHRGGYWANAQRFTGVVLMAIALTNRAPFPVLAAAQLAPLLIFLWPVLLDVRRSAPRLAPSLRHGSWRQVAAIIRPSGQFGLIAIAGFLTWQGPLLLIELVLGPAAAGLFGLVRVVFQMSRQLLALASFAIGQDITLLVGQRNWRQLLRLYDLSERLVLFLVPIVSVGSLLMCPLLFAVWLHKRDLYEPLTCTLMAAVSAVLGIKEHKTQFQSASNQHRELSYFVLLGYATMLTVSVFAMKALGLTGFIVTWLVWEVIQTAFILRLNARLFPSDFRISTRPVARLAGLLAVSFLLAAGPAFLDKNWSLGFSALVAVGITASLGVASYFLFGADELVALLSARLRSRFAAQS